MTVPPQLPHDDRFFRQIVEASSDLVLVIGHAGEVVYANPATERILGYDPNEVGGWAVLEHVHPEDAPSASRAIQEEMSGGNEFPVLDTRVRAKDGAWVPLEAKIWLMPGSHPPRLALIARDLRVRQAAERHLAEREAWAHAVLEASPIAIVTLDERLRVAEWSATATRLYGWDSHEARGQLHPAVQTAGEDVAMLREVISAGQSVVDQTASRRRRDGTLLEVSLALAPLRRLDGTLAGLVELSTDLTAQRAVARQFERAQRLESLGRMATGVARDLERTISAIELQLNVATGSGSLSLRDVADAVRGETEHARALVAQLRELGAPMSALHGQSAPDEVLRQVAAELRGATSAITVRSELRAPPELEVPVPEERLRGLLDILIRNAREAMTDKGTITLRLLERRVAEGDASAAGVHSGHYVAIEVADTGPGLSGGSADRVFDPFFTTKDTSRHRGLGLSRALASARRVGGALTLTPSAPQGLTATLLLPVTNRAPTDVDAAQVEPSTAPGRPARRHAFVLELRPDGREHTRRTLESDGYTVHTVSDAESLRRLAGLFTPALLLVPLLLPDGTGRELAQRLRSLHPDVRVIYTSPTVGGGVGPLGPMDALLTTPFTAGELLTATQLLRTLG